MNDDETRPNTDSGGEHLEAPRYRGDSGLGREPLAWDLPASLGDLGQEVRASPSSNTSDPGEGHGIPDRCDDITGRQAAAIGLSLMAVALAIVAIVSLAVRQSDIRHGSSSRAGLSRAGLPADVASIANRADEGVVNITSRMALPQGEAFGTGVVISASGEVLTNHHVIDGATSISVTDIGNGRTYSATVVGSDDVHDIAVLRLQGATGLKTIPVGDSSKVAVGDAVIALGNALGRGGLSSIATGKITALNQSITATDQNGANGEQLAGLIQIDAPLQPGDSGGPLVDSNGKLIGIDTAASGRFRFRRIRRAGNEAYAVPIKQAMAIANRIESGQAP